jgi:RNA polymerase primary sigma factor
MEAELRPQVMETLDTIAETYKKLRKLQDQQVEARLAATGRCRRAQERRYKELKDALITAVKSLSLNQNRIDSLVEQLYDINKRLVQNEGRLLRLAESYGVKRDDFLTQYSRAPSLIRTGSKSIANLSAKGWKEFVRIQQHPRDARRDPVPGDRDRHLDLRVPPHRATRCRRASARRASPRRKWSRPTCAW